MLGGATLLFLLVATLLLVAFLRPWVNAGSARWWLVGGGVIMPTVVLTALLAYVLIGVPRFLPAPDDQSTTRVDVLARQWAWTFTYPQKDGPAKMSDGILHLPAGRPVDLYVTSADVIHSFWVPRLGGKIDAIPGRINVVQLTASAPGTLHGLCAEFCGTDHTHMRIVVQVHDEADYARIVAGLAQAATPPPDLPRPRVPR